MRIDLLVDLHRQKGEMRPKPKCNECGVKLNPFIPRSHPQVCDPCLWDALEPKPPVAP